MSFPTNSFWIGKRVLVTGHTGFKGSWLTLWLHRMGAKVFGMSLNPLQPISLFESAQVIDCCTHYITDIRDRHSVEALFKDVKPEVVFHLAAQPLVRLSYKIPIETFDTNVMGTAHVLEAARFCDSVGCVVVATTDKVYANHETGRPFLEQDSLGGHDPYSGSKAACEMLVATYRTSYFLPAERGLVAARAGNVIGGGDWSADRLIPDAIRAWCSGNPVFLRNPHSSRPWQHVLEPVSCYLKLAERLWTQPDLVGSINIGPGGGEVATVEFVINLAKKHFPGALASLISDSKAPHEAKLLSLDTNFAQKLLNYTPNFGLDESVSRTVDWYLRWSQGENARILCNEDISYFEQKRLVQDAL